jgi:hypothetical protein
MPVANKTVAQIVGEYQNNVAHAPRATGVGISLSASAVDKLPIGARYRETTEIFWEIGPNGKPRLVQSAVVGRERV